MLSRSGRIQQLQAYAAAARYASLHLSFPGDTGTGEIAGVARALLGWGTPGNDGLLTAAGTTNWSVANASGVNWIGFWSAASGGSFLGFLPWGGREQPYMLVAGRVRAYAHGFSENAPIVFVGARPSPLNEGARYYARNVTQDEFSVAATQNGTVIPLTQVVGDGFVSLFPGATFAAGAVASASDITVAIDAGVSTQAPLIVMPQELPALPGDTLTLSSFVQTPDNFPVDEYFVAQGTLPTGATLNVDTGVLTISPSAPFANTVVRFGVRDTRGLEGVSADVTIRINGAPVWIDNDVTITQGGNFSLKALCTDPDGGTITFQAPNGLPSGFTLFATVVSTSPSVPAGIYNIVFSASDGIATPVLQTIIVTVNQIPVTTGSLVITQTPRFKQALNVPNGVKWLKYEIDIRGGIYGWGAANHGESGTPTNNVEPDSHSLRYFNTSSVDYAPSNGKIIPAGEELYLVDFGHSSFVGREPYAKVSDYDNLIQHYIPSEDKMFWIPDTGPANGGRSGIFDFKVGDWTYGNNNQNANQWVGGPYWGEYVKATSTTGGQSHIYNSPNAFVESLEVAINVSYGSGEEMMTIERNHNYPHAESQPWKIYTGQTPWVDGRGANLPRDYGYRINDNAPPHNNHMNSGCKHGEDFYFIKPMTGNERAAAFGSSTSPQLEFWRFSARRPHNLFKKLAAFPNFYFANSWADLDRPVHPQFVTTGSSPIANIWDTTQLAPLLVVDPPSRSIIALNDKVWVYDMDADTWTDMTPIGFKRVMQPIGVYKRDTREIFYRSGAGECDYASGTGVWWYKITLTGGEKPRLTWTDAEMDMDYGRGTDGSAIPFGKHRRGIALPLFRKADDGLAYTGAKRNADGTLTDIVKRTSSSQTQAETDGEYLLYMGGDYQGTPFTGASEVSGYPVKIAFRGGKNSSGIDVASRSTSGAISGAGSSNKYWGYRVPTTLTGAVTLYDARVLSDGTIDYALSGGQPVVIETIPAGTAGGTRVDRSSGYIPAKGVYASFAESGGSVSAMIADSWAWDSGRKDQWMFHVTEWNGKHQCMLAQNQVAFYPYPGGPDPTTIELGPAHPDGCGVVVDKRGEVWVGPGRFRFATLTTVPESVGSTENAMYRWRMPNRHTNGVRKGNGWWKPPQQNAMPWSSTIGDNAWTAYDPIHDHVVYIYPVGGNPWKYVVNRFDVRPESATFGTWLPEVGINFGNFPDEQQRYVDFAATLTRNGVSPQTNPSQLMGGPIAIYGEYAYKTVQVGHNTAGMDGRVWFIVKIKLTDLSSSTKPIYIGHPAEAYWQRAWDKPSIAGGYTFASINQARDMHGCGQLLVFGPPALEYVASEDPWCYVYDVNRDEWWISETYNQMRQKLVDAGVAAADLPPANHTGPLTANEDEEGSDILQEGPYMARGRSVIVPSRWELWHLTSGDAVPDGTKYRNTKFGFVKMKLPWA